MKKPLCISTLDLKFFQHGGVVTKAILFAQIAENEGFAPFFLTPSLPLHRTFRRTCSLKFPLPLQKTEFQGYPCFQLGARYTEFEFNAHRFDRRSLQTVLPEPIPCFAVSGNNQAAQPFQDLDLTYGVWPGSTYWEDCRYRIAQAPWSIRKILDLATRTPCEALERDLFQNAKQIVVDTQYTLTNLLKINRSWSEKSKVVPVPVDCHKYQPLPNPSREQFLFLGRLSDPRKNLPLLLDAFSIVASHLPSPGLTLVGSGEEATRTMLQKHPFSHRIQWLQGIPESEKIARIQNALALIIPSFQEGYGIVGAEAMACGVPVISTPCGGTEDFVIHDQTGLLLRNFDPQEMADAMEKLSKDQSRQQRLGIQAREFALQHLSLEAVRPLLQQFICKSLPNLQ